MVSSSQVAASRGRPLAAGPNATTTVPLIAPGTMYGGRLYQLDGRLSKTWKLGRDRIQGRFIARTLLNPGPILGVSNSSGAAWQTATATRVGRIIKFGVQADFQISSSATPRAWRS